MTYLTGILVGSIASFIIHFIVFVPHYLPNNQLNAYYSDELFGIAIILLVSAIACVLLKMRLKVAFNYKAILAAQLPLTMLVVINMFYFHTDYLCVLNLFTLGGIVIASFILKHTLLSRSSELDLLG